MSFEDFTPFNIAAGDADIFGVKGGSGPPLLLLHGYPQTHMIWHRCASQLAQHFTVIATDLRGYGASGKPASDASHTPYSKRAMAADQVAVMKHFGYERFWSARTIAARGLRTGWRSTTRTPSNG